MWLRFEKRFRDSEFASFQKIAESSMVTGGQISIIVSFTKEDRSLKITVPLPVSKLMVKNGEIQLFQKFQKIADGGPRRKTEKFWQIEKKIIDL